MAHITSKLKRKKYNLNLNLVDIPEKKKKQKPKTSKNRKPIENSAKVPPDPDVDQTKINPGDEFDGSEEVTQESSDPFVVHLRDELSPTLHAALSEKCPRLKREEATWPCLGRLLYLSAQLPSQETNKVTEDRPLLGRGEASFATVRPLPPPPIHLSYQHLHIKPQIASNLQQVFSNNNETKQITPLQRELLEIISNYHDLYYPEITMKTSQAVRQIYCAHIMNHIVKTRTKIIHHNAKLETRLDVPDEFRDQGLVRPKVLILAPFRSTAHRIVQELIAVLLGDGGNIMNKKRFLDEYSGDTLVMPEKNPKPIDYQEMFSGNTDDNFKIGLTVTKKCLKLYGDFYSSDIIIASPLGLRVLIGTEGESGRDYDFLSSIEILVLDQAHVFVMQNIEHLFHVVDHLHLQPKESHNTDLSRARSWALNGWSRYYMQSLLLSSSPLPELNSLFTSRLLNYAGKVVVTNPVTAPSIAQVLLPAVPQMFHYIACSSLSESVDARFETFCSTLLPRFKEAGTKHVLIYIPSYFDFVRLRNHFKSEELHYVHICEYTQEKKIIRARSKLFHGETQFLLYTERFHFFRRIYLRGVSHIVFYAPPTFPHFYSEISNFLQDMTREGDKEAGELSLSIDVLYTKFDVTQLSGIIGTERATRVIASEKPLHLFMTDSSS